MRRTTQNIDLGEGRLAPRHPVRRETIVLSPPGNDIAPQQLSKHKSSPRAGEPTGQHAAHATKSTNKLRATFSQARQFASATHTRITQSLHLPGRPTARATLAPTRATQGVPFASLLTDEPLPPAKGPTMLALCKQSVRDVPLRSDGSMPTLPFDEATVELLLRRNVPKHEAADDLIAAPVERAFDSILADEMITSMPEALRRPYHLLAQQACGALQECAPPKREAWLHAMIAELRKEFPRPWTPKTPITTLLCSDVCTFADKQSALFSFWEQLPADGFEAMASMTILRALYMGAERLGISRSVTPFVSKASDFYVTHLLPQTGRLAATEEARALYRQGAGITTKDAASPIDAGWMLRGQVASFRHAPDLRHQSVREALSMGNGYGVGISGSTNLFLFAVSYYQQLGIEDLDPLALTTSIAAMLCYNGGHTLHEVFAAAKQFPGAKESKLSALSDYQAGHARAHFTTLAKSFGVGDMLPNSLLRLAMYLSNQ